MRKSSDKDHLVIQALRSGDEATFVSLVEAYHPAMLRLARIYVATRQTAEDVVQETWVGVLHGLDRFEGRSTLKTWVFSILINSAKTRGQRESRMIPFSSLRGSEADGAEPSVAPERFRPAGQEWAGGWISFPRHWDAIPEEQLLSRETGSLIRDAIDKLEPNQREVITLRDIEGWSSREVCNVLEISETNQRVLLHRARSRVRHALEQYFDDRGMSRPTRADPG